MGKLRFNVNERWCLVIPQGRIWNPHLYRVIRQQSRYLVADIFPKGEIRTNILVVLFLSSDCRLEQGFPNGKWEYICQGPLQTQRFVSSRHIGLCVYSFTHSVNRTLHTVCKKKISIHRHSRCVEWVMATAIRHKTLCCTGLYTCHDEWISK